jgi:hypothetical protein
MSLMVIADRAHHKTIVRAGDGQDEVRKTPFQRIAVLLLKVGLIQRGWCLVVQLVPRGRKDVQNVEFSTISGGHSRRSGQGPR